MTTIGNVGLTPLSEVTTKGGTGRGSDAPAGKDAFHSILAHVGQATARSTGATGGVVADDDNDGAADKSRAIAKAIQAVKDRPRQKSPAEPLPSEPPRGVVLVVADRAATEPSAMAQVAPTLIGAPDIKLAIPVSGSHTKAAPADKLDQAGIAKSVSPQGPTKGEAPSVMQPAENPSSSGASDPIALRVSGTAPVGWRQDPNQDAPVPADNPIQSSPASAPTIEAKASIMSIATHAWPAALSQLPPATTKTPLPAALDDDGVAAEDPAIRDRDQAAGEAATARDKPRKGDDADVVRAERASSNVADRPSEFGAGSARPAAPADTAGMPSAAVASVVDAVVSRTNRLESVSAVANIAAMAGPSATSIGEVRTLTMRLDLPEHGGVSLRISLKGNALSLNLTADRDDTAKRLRHDRDALTSSLRDHGYDADIRSIDVGRPDAPPASRDATGARDQNSATADSGSGQPGSDQRPTEPRQQDRGGRPYRETDAPQETRHEKSKPDDSRGRGLYV